MPCCGPADCPLCWRRACWDEIPISVPLSAVRFRHRRQLQLPVPADPREILRRPIVGDIGIEEPCHTRSIVLDRARLQAPRRIRMWISASPPWTVCSRQWRTPCGSCRASDGRQRRFPVEHARCLAGSGALWYSVRGGAELRIGYLGSRPDGVVRNYGIGRRHGAGVFGNEVRQRLRDGPRLLRPARTADK